MSFRICSREFIFGSLGICFVTVGIVFYVNLISWFTILRGKEMALSPSSPSFAGWKSSPLPLFLDIYLFNWTNSHQFTNHSIKPKFQELGPYRFRDIPDKVNIIFHPHNYSVTFQKTNVYHFDAEGSNGSLSDIITTLNMVAWSAANKQRNLGFLGRNFFNSFLLMSKEELTVTKTVDEILFSGYQDPLVDIHSFVSMFSSQNQAAQDRVGYFYKRNGSTEYNGLLNMFTGEDDIKKMGKVHTWNYKNHSGFYESTCGMLNGSLGEFFPPNLKEGGSIELFNPSMCRTVPLDYTETVDVHGVKSLKFAGGRRSVDNGTMYPETKCFCVNGKCERAGVMNMAPCQPDTTVFMSYPHFYQADPYYLEQIEGLNPVKEKHEFFMTLEPNTGVPLDVGGGFQANVLIERIPNLGIYDKVPRIFLPIMWCEERVRVSPEIAAEVELVPLIIYWVQVAIGVEILFGLVLFCWYPINAITAQCTPKDQRKFDEHNQLKQQKAETTPFMDTNNICVIITRPQDTSLTKRQLDLTNR